MSKSKSSAAPSAPSASSLPLARRAFGATSLTLIACAGLAGLPALAGCGDADPADATVDEAGELGDSASSASSAEAAALSGGRLSAEQLAALRTPDLSESPGRAEFAAELAAQARRAQAYLDAQIVPRLDGALRATSGLTYAQLRAEAVAATAAADPEAAAQAFLAARGEAIEAAVAHLGTTTAALGEEVRLASLDEQAAAAAALSAALPPPPRSFGGCFTGHEFEPYPPYFQAGNWFVGFNSATLPTVNVNGNIRSEANLIVGGTTQVGGWVRADNVPPSGAGITQVSTSVFFSTALSELTLWVPSYAGSGVGLTIEVFDRAAGTFLGSCRRPILDAAIPVGYRLENRSVVASHACAFHHPSSTMLMARVHIDAYGTSAAPFGSVARAVGEAQVQTIRFLTCLD